MARWTEADLNRVTAKAGYRESGGCYPGGQQGAQPEPAVRCQPLVQKEDQGGGSAQFWVRIESIRKRLLDPDNLCPKYHIDCLRYAGVLPDDTAETVRIETVQRKPKKGEEEGTLIHVWRI